MEKSSVIQLNLSGESTDEEFSIPLNNNPKNVSGSDQEARQVIVHSEYLDLGKEKNPSLQAVENEGFNESGYDEYSTSHHIRSAVKTLGSEVDGMTSNMSRTNNNYSTADDQVLPNNPKNECDGDDQQQQTNVTEHRRNSVIFGLKTKLKLRKRAMEDEEFDDSGIILDNSNEIGSARKSDSVVTDKLSTASKSDLSQNHSESDEGGISDTGSKDENETADIQQVNRIEHHYKVFALKRKLISEAIENEESTDLGEKPNKRGRGRYMLRDVPGSSFSAYANNKKPKQKRLNKFGKANTSQVNNEDKTEDSDTDVVTTHRNGSKRDKPQDMDGSLSGNQVQHNNMILKLLNEGSPENIKTLSRVGLKTAMMIHQYRKLNGKLKSIRDLENMPGWSQRFFELFLSTNNIVLD